MIINFNAWAGKNNFHSDNLQSIKWKTVRRVDGVGETLRLSRRRKNFYAIIDQYIIKSDDNIRSWEESCEDS